MHGSNAAGNCLNMSMCAYTTGVDQFTVLAWNPEAQNVSTWLRIPVSGAAYTVTDLSTKAVLPNQATALDNRTLQLPLLYLNKHGMKASQIATAEAALANKATHVLSFEVSLPPVGYSSFLIKKSAATAAVTTAIAAPSTVSNGVYEITINKAAGMIESVKNLASGATSSLNISWGYYVSSEGACVAQLLPCCLPCTHASTHLAWLETE